MIRNLSYKTRGTCARQIKVSIDEDDTILSVQFENGCDGNTEGISQLVRGMKAKDAMERLRGIRCGSKATSCPDQLTHALEECLAKSKETAK